MGERLELFGGKSCPYTEELREDLEWRGKAFVEYDVEDDGRALARMLLLTGGDRTIPVLVVDGKVGQVGWQGRGCLAPAQGAEGAHSSDC